MFSIYELGRGLNNQIKNCVELVDLRCGAGGYLFPQQQVQ